MIVSMTSNYALTGIYHVVVDSTGILPILWIPITTTIFPAISACYDLINPKDRPDTYSMKDESCLMVKDLIIKGIKRPHRIPSYLKYKLGYIFNFYIRKRVHFTYEDVVSGYGIKGAGLPYFSARLHREVKLLNEAIGSYHAKRSLEIGCGYGRLTPWIAEHSDQHYAIEPEPVLLNDARKLYPNICFYLAKAQKLPFPNYNFDLCISWTVLMHIPPKELTKAVTEIKRVCTPEAIIILGEGVGGEKSKGVWTHTLEEWKDLFLPWKLTWCTERRIEETFKGSAGLVMRFEGSGQMRTHQNRIR